MSKYILPTYTGKLFDLENPTEDMIDIEDIAHHLSLENRYNGATKFPLSVAHHSILVCKMAPEELKLEALLHDAEEAYYKDFTAPLKRMLNDWAENFELASVEGKLPTFYYYIIKNFYDIFISKFKLEDPKQIIKEIDLRMASTEILQLLHNFKIKHWQHDYDKYPEYSDVKIYNEEPLRVERMFLDEYEKWRRD